MESSAHKECENIDINLLCRVCCKTSRIPLIPIYDDASNELASRINSYLPINVSFDDVLPKKVCFQCVNSIFVWHEFTESCINADFKFKEMLTEMGILASEEDNVENSVEGNGEVIAKDIKMEMEPTDQTYIKKEIDDVETISNADHMDFQRTYSDLYASNASDKCSDILNISIKNEREDHNKQGLQQHQRSLHLQEIQQMSNAYGYDVLTGLPKQSTICVPSVTGPLQNSKSGERQLSSKQHSSMYVTTSYTTPSSAQLVSINGRELPSLQHLEPTTTIEELNTRADNTHQRFITREGIEIYLQRHVLQRIDFNDIRKRKNKDKTINLPNRYQVRLHVRADGKFIFHHYHKRGISKIRAQLNANVQPGGGECSATEQLNK